MNSKFEDSCTALLARRRLSRTDAWRRSKLQFSAALNLADAFCASGLTVLRCDLPFRQSASPRTAARGSAERDQQGLRAAVMSIRRHISGRVFLGGHSYGGRQASMLAAAEPGLVDKAPIAHLTRSIRRNGRASYGPGISQASEPQRCSFMACGMDLAPSMK